MSNIRNQHVSRSDIDKWNAVSDKIANVEDIRGPQGADGPQGPQGERGMPGMSLNIMKASSLDEALELSKQNPLSLVCIV